jgi:acyl-coenzyme A synthetase/AMP-(fatty) acid ligase
LVLVDELGAEVPQGATGEICVTRGPVFQGYWGDPSLSLAKRLAGRTDSYRTGDLGKIGLDGLLRLAGRKDDAVKLHGHRFELGEIAAALKRHPAVRDAVVFVALGAQGDSEVRAAVLAAESGDLAALLRRFCHDRLPAYAQPSHIEVLESFPTLSSGKVDRQALARVLSSPNADS